jgi:hypothetical protein
MSEHIQAAIDAVLNTKPTDFKNNIYNVLQQKMNDVMFLKKMQVANQIFNHQEESSTNDFELSTEEENIDEDF